MRGSVFVEFLNHVEQQYGFDMIDSVLEKAGEPLSTGGAYTSVGNYPHTELLSLAVALSSLTGTDGERVIRDFAEHLMAAFHRMHPEYFKGIADVYDFLSSVGTLIHKDVRKLYSDARPPLVHGERLDDGTFLLRYESHRPLAQLAMAMTEVSGQVFDQPLSIEVVERSQDDCRITMKLSKLP